MRILWVTNILPQFLAKRMGKKTNNNLGWLDYSAEKLMENTNYKLSVLYPDEVFASSICDEIECHTFPSRFLLKRNDKELILGIAKILNIVSPDIIHIYGTEYFHTVAVVKAAKECGYLDRTIISIQGLVSVCAEHYLAGLPHYVTTRYTLRDFIKRENLVGQSKQYAYRGKGEIEALEIAQNVIGRTEWDKCCTEQINSMRRYFFCNETLRKTFYIDHWSYDNCEKHSIFVSQSSYAIKGMHQMIKALPIILKKYPDAKVYVTGKDVFAMKWYRINSYHLYLKQLISKFNLKDKIIFLGALNEDQMKTRFLNSNVFVNCSSIENSPNSLGEAMILGVPCISSDVGGVVDIFTHNQDGYTYPYDEPYMLAHYVCKMFENREVAEMLANNARHHALKTHDPENNYNTLCEIYNTLLEGTLE